jgi:hypothetical protein
VRSRWIVATLMTLIGLIFVGQGTGIIRGSSSMVDDVRWAIVGLVLIVAGTFVGWTALRNRRRA